MVYYFFPLPVKVAGFLLSEKFLYFRNFCYLRIV